MNTSQETEIRLRLFKILSEESDLSQREIARRMGISLGKTNYCISEFVKKGFVKMQRFNESKTKFRYLYHLTPKGIEAKGTLAIDFLRRKMHEYEEIKQQIQTLTIEMENEKIVLPEIDGLSDIIQQGTD